MTWRTPPAPDRGDAWSDQTVYVLIPHKFHDGDPANNHMRARYKLPTPAYEGGFLGGDIAGIRQKVGNLKGLGVKTSDFKRRFPAFHSSKSREAQ